ncbi:MAG: hypothetical protein AAB425_08850 [Bdellovibrionota bacterium]
MKDILIAIGLSVLATSAQAISWPYENQPIITDDFGRRLLKGGNCDRPSSGIDFHYGIDFKPFGVSHSAVAGQPIRAITGGIITYVSQGHDQQGRPILIRLSIDSLIDGSHRRFNYLHFFHNGALPLRSGIFEIRKSTEPGQPLYIIRKASGTIPAAAFAQIADLSVPGFPDLTTQNSVSEGDLIAPTGNSGGSFGPHLHLGLDMDFANSGQGQCGKTA